MFVADDYGMSIAINSAVDEVAKGGVLTHASVMCIPGFRENLSRIDDSNLRFGLHITLSNHQLSSELLSFRSVLYYFFNLGFRSEIKSEIKREICLQLNEFRKIFSKNPEFIDGHQFVHQSPIVLDVLSELYGAGIIEKTIWVRVFDQPFNFVLSRLFREPLALIRDIPKLIYGKVAKRRLSSDGVTCNRFLFHFGHRRVSKMKKKYIFVSQFYDESKDMIYFHPSMSNDEGLPKTEFIDSRVAEFDFLKGLEG